MAELGNYMEIVCLATQQQLIMTHLRPKINFLLGDLAISFTNMHIFFVYL